MRADSRAVPLWVRDRLPDGEGDATALWLTVRLRLPRIGIGYVDWAQVARKLGWTVERASAALDRLEEAGLLFADGALAWAPGSVEADNTLHLTHHLQRMGVLNALSRLPERPLVSAFRLTYGLDSDDWESEPLREPAEALATAGQRSPATWAGGSNGWVVAEVPRTNGKAPAGATPSRNGAGNGWEGRNRPAVGKDTPADPKRNGAEGASVEASVEPRVRRAPSGPSGPDLAGSFPDAKHQGGDTPPKSSLSASLPRNNKGTPYDALWAILKEQQMVKPVHRLTALRRSKLKALWEEHLRRAEDPADLLRRICRAVQRDNWWGVRPETWLPETCWRNAERREKFTLIAEEDDERGRGAGGASGPLSAAGGPGGNQDRYRHLVSRRRDGTTD